LFIHIFPTHITYFSHFLKLIISITFKLFISYKFRAMKFHKNDHVRSLLIYFFHFPASSVQSTLLESRKTTDENFNMYGKCCFCMETFRIGNIPIETSTKTEDFYFLRGKFSIFISPFWNSLTESSNNAW